MRAVHEVEDSVDLELGATNERPVFKPHWQIFAPTVIVFFGYMASLVYLWATGRADGSLFRLAAIVSAIGVPLLTAHAFLRYETVRVRFSERSIRYHSGWPKDRWLEIPFELIETMQVKRGLAGRLLGGGTLVIETSTGSKVAIADLRSPDRIVEMYEQLH